MTQNMCYMSIHASPIDIKISFSSIWLMEGALLRNFKIILLCKCEWPCLWAVSFTVYNVHSGMPSRGPLLPCEAWGYCLLFTWLEKGIQENGATCVMKSIIKPNASVIMLSDLFHLHYELCQARTSSVGDKKGSGGHFGGLICQSGVKIILFLMLSIKSLASANTPTYQTRELKISTTPSVREATFLILNSVLFNPG